MAITSAGLPGGGRSDPGGHYQIGYDDSLSPSDGLTRAEQLWEACEHDFLVMESWFGNVGLKFNFPIFVNINNASGGASWSDPSDFKNSFGFNPTVEINPGKGTSVDFIRMLLTSEVTEMLMATKNNGWFASGGDIFSAGDEGSKGEGLSRFLAFQLTGLVNGNPLVPIWLNSARANYVDNNPDDHTPDAVNGCTTAFIYYLNAQLGFGINAIINAGASTLAGVYTNLTGKTDAWNSFINLVNLHFPPTDPAGRVVTYHPPTDNLFPVPVLWGFPDDSLLSGETQSIPDAIQLFQVASAEVTVELSSDNPAVLTIPPNITFPPTTDAASLTIQAASVTGPLQTVKIHATYAGTTLSSNIQIRPRPGIISGQVTDVSQNPIAGASVTIATNQFIFSNSSSVQLTTDSNGFYQSPQIPPGVYQISATLWGYVASEVFNVTADVGVPDISQNITLIATKPFAISGKVTDLSGSAIPLATVAFNNSPVAKTGAQGDYSFSWDPGSAANDLPYTISVHQTGYTTGSLTIPIANGATITENFVLQLLGSLSGFVTDTSNTPIQGATVAAASGSVESDVSGQYVLAGLNPGANNISVKASGFDPLQTSVSVNPGPTITTQNLTLSKGSGVITGHVEIVGPQGDVSPLPHVAISVTELSSAQTFIRSETDADGNYTISNVPSGQASVSVIFRPSQTSVVEVSAHQTIVLNFVFQPKVLPPGPKPI